MDEAMATGFKGGPRGLAAAIATSAAAIATSAEATGEAGAFYGLAPEPTPTPSPPPPAGPLCGDAWNKPLPITGLPLSHQVDSTLYTNKYKDKLGWKSKDVVFQIQSSTTCTITASTCSASTNFDTVLVLLGNENNQPTNIDDGLNPRRVQGERMD